ncbi:hypothetical protein ACFOY4_01340 [Actinomadura syzygii]|uniref:hypothetical protein n=1 Tax=Actinomadura syzygii TaxID=1427538 RepID=UPI001FE6F30F|nr:hypothetical protein [Actinomadura syzygii]
MTLEIAPEAAQRAVELQDLAARTGPGARPTPEQLARLAELDVGADGYLQQKRNANTARAYAADWAVWSEFCAAVGIPEVPASRGSLTAFVRFRWLAGHAPATIERSFSGISHGHTERGVQIDRAATRHARAVLAAEVRARPSRDSRRAAAGRPRPSPWSSSGGSSPHALTTRVGGGTGRCC